ncbi:MAG: anthranilate synthase component I [Candidatus Choladocola sp.]|nr:anthranilate synthase component I [Candidatus Choladocola sp.]
MYPSLEQAKQIAASGEYRRIPVCRELLSDRFTTIEVMRTLRAASSHCYLLESAESHQQWGRYSFLGYAPTLEITCMNGIVKIRKGEDICTGRGAVTEEIRQESPQDVIREVLQEYKSPKMEGMPPFTGGLVGYFSYDYICYSEPTLKLGGEDREAFQDVDLMLFDRVIAFDNYRQKLILICGVSVENLEQSYRRAEKKLQEMEELLKSSVKAYFPPIRLEEEIRPCFPKERYEGMVEKAKHYIREGDIFQVVLSNPMEAKAEGSLFDTYRILRTTNPSPYMFYFTSDDIELVGASPETLVKLEDGILHTFPLAGTRPRGRDREEDRRLEKELLADEKELAEHNMLVDLGRNDIGKISEIGSVHVEKYLSIERYSHVMHIGSTVAGRIRSDKDAVDAVDAILPAGTLSGAPKLRACQIIDELEGRKRGVYGGAIGYLDFTGNLDTCIAIRLAFKKNGRVTIRSGAGIVADSVPEKEFEECCNKAKAVVSALKQAEEGAE